MRGKYSPTVTAAYMADQNWHRKFMAKDGFLYDPEGYDSYGYNEDNVDRAGNSECDYYHNDCDPFESDDDYNWKYDSALAAWTFNGTKPVLK
jgi:hypothetical protein